MAAYGDSGPRSRYEYDHFVPLELGGAVNDPRDLWPEPGASPNPKDAVEDELNREVCDGQMALAQAQRHRKRLGCPCRGCLQIGSEQHGVLTKDAAPTEPEMPDGHTLAR